MLRIQLHTIHLSFAHSIRFPHTARSALLTYPPLLTECVASILMIQICIFNHATRTLVRVTKTKQMNRCSHHGTKSKWNKIIQYNMAIRLVCCVHWNTPRHCPLLCVLSICLCFGFGLGVGIRITIECIFNNKLKEGLPLLLKDGFYCTGQLKCMSVGLDGSIYVFKVALRWVLTAGLFNHIVVHRENTILSIYFCHTHLLWF